MKLSEETTIGGPNFPSSKYYACVAALGLPAEFQDLA